MIYRVLPVSAADIPALYECVCKVFSETDFMLISAGELDNSFDNFRKHIEQVIASSKNCFLIARDDDQVIGWIDVSGSHFKKKRHSAYLVTGLLKNYWGKGIGTKLMDGAMAWAMSEEITRLELTVVESNIRAINLYKRHGFVQEGIKQKSILINGQYKNELMMAKVMSAN